jgi:hypothetical protein
MAILDSLRSVLDRTRDDEEVFIRMDFGYPRSKDNFVKMLGAPTSALAGEENTGVGNIKSFGISYSRLCGLIGATEQIIQRNLRSTASSSRFFEMIKDQTQTAYFEERGAPRSISTNLLPPLIRFLDEPANSQKYDIIAIDRDEPVYTEMQ